MTATAVHFRTGGGSQPGRRFRHAPAPPYHPTVSSSPALGFRALGCACLAAIALGLALTPGAPARAQAPDKAARYYEDALTRYEKRDHKGAIIQLKNALQVDRNMLPVHVLLGKALLADGDVNAAEVAFNEALRLGVNRAEVVVPLANTVAAQGKPLQLFEQARFATSGLPAATRLQLHLVRAEAASDMGDPRRALEEIAQARSIDPQLPAVWAAEVPVRVRERQFREATAAAERALALAPTQADVLYQAASILHAQGDRRGALAAYDRVLRSDPGHVEGLVARAGLLVDLQQMPQAGADLDALGRVAPKEPRAAYLRALLAERAGDPASARAALGQVTLLLDPVPIDFIRYRPQLLMLNGLAHYGLGEREKAKPYLEEVQKRLGGSPVSKLLAQIYMAESNSDRAVEVLEQYLKRQPGDAQAMTLLASAYMGQGRYAKATNLIQDALRSGDSPELQTALGLSLLGARQGPGAVKALESAFAKDPKQVQAGVTLVGLYLRGGQPAKARAVTERLLEQQPSNPGFYNLNGLAKVALGDRGGARQAFDKALQLDPKFAQASLSLARLDIAGGAYDAARARLEALLQADEKNVEALFEVAVIADRRGQPAESLRWLQKAVDHAPPRELRPLIALVDLQLRQGRPDEALAAARRATSLVNDDLNAVVVLARAQLASGDAAGARSTLSSASRIAGFAPAPQVQIALLQLQANDASGAEYSLGKALSAREDYLPAQALMTEVVILQGDLADAERRARGIAQAHPKRAIGYSLLGQVADKRGQAAVATDAYTRAFRAEPSTETLRRLFHATSAHSGLKAAVPLAQQWLAKNPRDVAVLRDLGDAQVRARNFAAARTAYEAILKVAPEDAGALNNLAGALLVARDPAALAYAERAVKASPASAAAIDTLGWAAFQAGQTDRALQLLRDARLRDPANPEIRYHLGVVLAKAGKTAEARAELEASLRPGAGFEGRSDAEAALGTLK